MCEQQQEQKQSVINSIFAWLSLLAGYAFCRAVPVHSHPFGAFLLILALLGATTIFLIVKKAKFSALTVLSALSAVVMSLSLIFSSNGFLHTIAFAYSTAAIAYYVYAACGNRLKDGFNDFIVWDFFKALVFMPFASFFSIFKALFSGKTKFNITAILKIIFGLILAIIPTALVIGLLSYDDGFKNLLTVVFDYEFGDIFGHIASAIFGIPIAFCFYSLLSSSENNKCKTLITADGLTTTSNTIKFIPALSSLAAVVPMLVVYVIFFISQWQYYISAFSGKIPGNLSIAGYARDGFFELCAVTVINLVIIALLALIVRGNAVKRILSAVLSLCTLVLIATAISKMVLYIDRFGLTRMRVYPLWFMLVLALAFIVIFLKQFFKSIPALAVSLAITVVAFSALSICNIDAVIANYNVERYLDGSLDEVDITLLENIGDSAVPALCRLKNESDDLLVKRDAREAIEAIEENRNISIWSLTIPRETAKIKSSQ